MAIEDEIKALAERNPREFTHRETDIVRSARSPQRTFGRTGNGGLPYAGPPTASVVRDRIGELIKRAHALSEVAQGIEGQLAGTINKAPEQTKPVNTETVFGRQMAALDELGEELDALARSLERVNGALA